MKGIKWLLVLVLCLLPAFLCSCGVQKGRYFKRLPPDWTTKGQAEEGKHLGRVKGEACVQIFWIGPIPIPINQEGDLETATKNALEEFNTLTKIKVDHIANVYENESFLVIPLPIGYYEKCTVVEGNAVAPSAAKTE